MRSVTRLQKVPLPLLYYFNFHFYPVVSQKSKNSEALNQTGFMTASLGFHSINFVTELPASLLFQCFSAATLLNSHAQRRRSAATLSGHAQRPCSAATLSSHAPQRPRSAAMLSGYIQQPRSAATLSGHAQRPRSVATLSGHAPKRPRSAATLLGGHAPQQTRSCSLCPIHFSLSTSTSGKVNN
jgi:hypothetical protein